MRREFEDSKEEQRKKDEIWNKHQKEKRRDARYRREKEEEIAKSKLLHNANKVIKTEPGLNISSSSFDYTISDSKDEETVNSQGKDEKEEEKIKEKEMKAIKEKRVEEKDNAAIMRIEKTALQMRKQLEEVQALLQTNSKTFNRMKEMNKETIARNRETN